LDFAKTLREYEAKLLRYAASLMGSAGAGDQAGAGGADRDVQPGDLVQEAFLRLHRFCREHGSSAIEHPGTWLYRVVHNLAMDTIRKRVRERGAQPKIEDAARVRAAAADASDEAALGQLEQRELVGLAMRLLGDLPEQQQQVIALKFMEGLTLRQIADVIDSTPGSVNYHLNQGLSRLAEQLRKKGAV
jgi:RNA polymerase sigma-70 factor (ECF subfamily)